MKLRDLRSQIPGLENYSDDEIAEALAVVQGYDPRDPEVRKMIEDFKGYDRSTGEVIGDTVTQLGQGVVKIGSNLASGFGAWDNPVRRGLDTAADWMGERFYSEGLRAQQAGREIYSNIRDREAEARGLRGPDRLAYDAQTALENYANAPGTLGADIFMNAPQLLVGGLAGRAGAAVGRGLGLSQRGAAVTGTAAGGGTAGFMQGADIGAQTYDEVLRAIMARNDAEAGLTADTIVVTPQGSHVRQGNVRTDLRLATDEERAEATALANQAALKSGALTAATSLIPGSLERSMIPGLGVSTTRLGSVARVGGVETATNIVDEGYGQLASGQAVAEVDPNRDPWAGVGEAGVQGGAAGGPAGAVGGMVAPLRPRELPRTETGEIDVTAPPTTETFEDNRGDSYTLNYGAPIAVPADIDRPTARRQGLDPLNERPVGPPAPPQQPTMGDLVTEPEPATFVDLVNRQPPRPLPPDPYTQWEQQAAQQPVAEPPRQLPYNPTIYTDPTGASQVGQMPSEQEVASRKYPVQPVDSDDTGGGGVPVTKDEVRQAVEDAAREIKQTYLKKDGTLTKTAEAIWAPILNAEDPVAAARELHQDGRHPRDEFIDEIHRRLTGMSVIEWRERQRAPRSPGPQTNQAGFVTEPLEQVQAQVQAVKEGRKESVVVPPEQADQVDLSGLAKTTVSDPNTGESAVVASRNRATVQRAAARTQEAGLRQALGEMQNRVEPTATTAPRGDEVVVQQRDNKTGQVLDDEAVTPENVPNVERIPDTTAEVVPAEAVVERQRPAEPKPKKPKAPRYGRKSVDELIEIADNTKTQEELDAAELELYKRWANQGDEQAEAYFDGQAKRVRELQVMLDAEREAAETKRGQELGRKFNSVKARPAESVKDKTPLGERAVRAIVDRIARRLPAARDIRIAANPEAVGIHEFEPGLVVEGATLPDGTIYLFTDNLFSTTDALKAVFHELFHKGVTNTPNYRKALLELAQRDPWIGAKAREWKITPDGRRWRDSLPKDEYDALAVEEALARVSEDLRGGENVGTKRTAIRGLVKWLAAKADDWGMPDLARWLRRATYTEAEKFVLDTLNAIPVTPPTGPRGGQTVRARVADSAPNTERERIAWSEENPFTRPLARAVKRSSAYLKSRLTGQDIDQSVLSLASPTMIMEQLGHKLPAFKLWFDTVIERGAHARKLANRADVTAQKWQKLDRAERRALGEILLEASSLGLSLDNTSAEYVNTLSAEERADHARLRKRLNGLSDEAKTIRAEVLGVLRDQWQAMRDGMIHLAQHTIHDPAARAERIKQIKDGFGQVRGDYFPLSRFGDNIVIARGAAKDGRDVVSFHESTLDAERERDRWRRDGVKNVVVTKATDKDFGEHVSTNFLNQVHQIINQADVDPGTRDLLHDAIQQMYLKSMPEFSGAKLMIRRENIEGYSSDAIRGFADAVARGARYAARLRYGPQMHAALEAAQAQSRSSDQRTAALVIGTAEGKTPVVRVVPVGAERLDAAQKLQSDGYEVEWSNTTPETVRETIKAKLPHLTDEQTESFVKQVEQTIGRTEEGVEDLRVARELYNYILRRNADDKSTPDGVAANIVRRGGQLGFQWFLGLTPTYWLMNSLQNHLVMLPHLGGKYGVGRSMAEMHRAMGWFVKVRMGKLLRDRKEPFSIAWLRKNAPEGVSEQEFRFLERLEDRGRLDITRSRDLSQIAEDSTGKFNRWMAISAAGAHHTEVFNRVVAALTAYRLARQRGATHTQAVETAENDLVLTHIDYSQENTANFMKGPYAGRIFMFQKYRQGMLYWWVKQVRDALGAATPEDRKAAGKAMGLMAASHLLAAGVRGLPFAGAFFLVADLIAAVAGDDDEPFDLQKEMEEALEEWLGPEAGRFFARGVFDAAGLDLSHRIGQHDLLPFTDWSTAKYERDGDDKVRAYLFDLLGPLGSVALGWGSGMDAAQRGDWLAAGAYMSPKFAADIFKAIDLHEQGLRDKRGQVIAQRELFDGWDIALQAVGTRPSTVADIRHERSKVRDLETHYQNRSQALTRYFTEAFKLQDQDGIQDAVEAITAFNRKVVRKHPQLVITGQRLEQAVRRDYQRQLINALTGGTADTRRQLMLMMQMTGMMQRPDEDWSQGIPDMKGY